jgi:hypothetical protein
MSADNGVYVLQTYGPQFRVTYAQNIDAIYGKFNDDTLHWDPDVEMIHAFFDQSDVFSDMVKALDFAEELSYNYEYLEYGVCLITDFKELKFNE